jgi:hypothetical protein
LGLLLTIVVHPAGSFDLGFFRCSLSPKVFIEVCIMTCGNKQSILSFTLLALQST